MSFPKTDKPKVFVVTSVFQIGLETHTQAVASCYSERLLLVRNSSLRDLEYKVVITALRTRKFLGHSKNPKYFPLYGAES